MGIIKLRLILVGFEFLQSLSLLFLRVLNASVALEEYQGLGDETVSIFSFFSWYD